jgi:protein transport protein SEC61 subunit gamma-like protein
MMGELKTKIGSFLVQCRRVWLILKKPSYAEFISVAKVSALGLLIIGAIGFAIAGLIQLLT